MPWTKGILLFTVLVMTFSSFTNAASEAGDASGDTIHFGKFLVGGEGAASKNKMGTSRWSSAKQSDEYQADEDERLRLAKAKLQRLSPSLHCGNDSMTLHVPGPRPPHFLVDRGERSPVSLSEMPASCGFSLKRVRRDVSFVAPYKGCHVRQEGGSYVLPLIIMGAPVQMSCPVSPRLPVVTCSSSAMKVSLCIKADDVTVKVDGLWTPLLLVSSSCLFTLETVGNSLVVMAPFTGSCWEMKDNERQLPLKYGGQEVVLSCPSHPATTVSPASTIPVRDPFGVPQMFPYFPYGDPRWYSYLKWFTTALPPTTTTTAAPPQDPIPPQILNQLYPMFNPYYFYSKGASQAAAPQQQSQQSWYSMIAPNYDFPQFKPLTAAPPQDPIPPQILNQLYPMFNPYNFYSKGASQAAAAAPPQQLQQSWYSMISPKYDFPQFKPLTPAPTTTTAAPFVPYPGYPVFPMFYQLKPERREYPFMPYLPRKSIFTPQSLNSVPPPWLDSIYRARWKKR